MFIVGHGAPYICMSLTNMLSDVRNWACVMECLMSVCYVLCITYYILDIAISYYSKYFSSHLIWFWQHSDEVERKVRYGTIHGLIALWGAGFMGVQTA